MRLVNVNNPRPQQKLLCVRCRQMKPLDQILADMDGQPYVDYYCLTCISSALTNYKSKEVTP